MIYFLVASLIINVILLLSIMAFRRASYLIRRGYVFVKLTYTTSCYGWVRQNEIMNLHRVGTDRYQWFVPIHCKQGLVSVSYDSIKEVTEVRSIVKMIVLSWFIKFDV